jgi:hypothetical protein
MKKLMQKIIEAGLVPAHTLRLMEKWKMVEVPDGTVIPSADDLKARTQEQLIAFAEEIGNLLEESKEMPELRETDLLLEHLFQDHTEHISVDIPVGVQRMNIHGLIAVQTRDDRIVLRRTGAEKYIEMAARPGSRIHLGDSWYEVMDVEVRYIREIPEFYSCGVRKLEKEMTHAEM